jgi:3-hydroxyisobutyrate dehydrogenase/2-hydroxy-3-oxopropionate reductase
VLEQAKQLNLDLPGASCACSLYERADKDGRGEEDFSAVIKVLRK